MPYFIKDPKNGAVFAIIDTTGKYTSLDNTSAKILLTETHVIFKGVTRQTSNSDLSWVKSFSLDQAKAQRLLAVGKYVFVPILYPAQVIIRFLEWGVVALLLALVGMIFAKIVKASLNYAALMRLAIVAATPAMIVDALRAYYALHIPAWNLLYTLYYACYLFFGVKANTATPEAATGGPQEALSLAGFWEKCLEGQGQVPLAAPLIPVLKNWLRKRGARSDWLFPSAAGTPLRDRNLLRRKVWPACTRLGIERFGWRSLRHTFSTYNGNAGVALPVLQPLLRHASPETTMIYTHPREDVKRQAIENLASLLFPNVPQKEKVFVKGSTLIQ